MGTLSYVLITPYTVAKSRTGGVIARLLSRAHGLELAGAQMVEPDAAFVVDYAELLRRQALPNPSALASYVETHFAPHPASPRRALLLLFRGEDVCAALTQICGRLYREHRSADDIEGETIRDTYADLIVSAEDAEKFDYFEPAILTPRTDRDARDDLALFARLLKGAGNIIENIPAPPGEKKERTLIIIKPDNWTYASARPGEILDMFSQTGLKIIGVKVSTLSLVQALEFYGPVEEVLREKLSPLFGKKARELLEREFSLPLDAGVEKALCESFGAAYARDQFYQIVDFMSGHRPDRADSRPVKCMIVVYEGADAVRKIREVLGPTDPTKAPAGTIRREFGSSVMVNAAHASDSAESFQREQAIVRINENHSLSFIEDYLGQR
jgi:nucleoside diphosphate kinase